VFGAGSAALAESLAQGPRAPVLVVLSKLRGLELSMSKDLWTFDCPLYRICFALSGSDEDGNHGRAGRPQVQDTAGGTARKHVNCDRLLTWNCALPPEDYLAFDARFFSAMYWRTDTVAD
jgi:hypothetical protein